MNGARSAHVGLESALCFLCICLISEFKRCGISLVHPFTSFFSPQVKKQVLTRACSRCGVEIGLLKKLGFFLCCAVARLFTLCLSLSCRKQRKKCIIHTMH